MNTTSHRQIHGSIPYALLRELNVRAEEVTDFSATVNPYPLPPEVNSIIQGIDLSAYPDPECFEARSALAGYLNVPLECITLAAGTTELLFALPLLYSNALCLTPTYGDYAAAYSRFNKGIASFPFAAALADPDSFAGKFNDVNPDILIICNPNNPDGAYFEPERIMELCTRNKDRIVCVDESYQELSDGCTSVSAYVASIDNLLVVKSLSKPYGIGGIRAGYAVAPKAISGLFQKKLLPWGVSTPAQRLVPVLVAQHEYFIGKWQDILNERDSMVDELRKNNMDVKVERTPFFLVEVGDASSVRIQLLREFRLLVRDCSSFGMPRLIRIMPSLHKANGMLVDALGTILQQGSITP